MLVRQAKIIARQWVQEEAAYLPGFGGAFFHGSINGLPDHQTLPPSSDIDLKVVFADPESPGRQGKFRYHDALLEVSCLTGEEIATPEQVLGNYHLAGSFRAPGIISDPSGQLTALQQIVGRDFAKRPWVIKRAEHAQSNLLNFLNSLKTEDPFSTQVMGWLFATGVMTHVLLAAGLQNPTVRRRYAAARELLAEYGLQETYEELLGFLGCARISRARVERHLAVLADAFDAAAAVRKTPYRFAADISPAARAVPIDGSRELIESGQHREAIFWIVATYSRCQWILSQDAPVETQNHFTHGYRDLLGDLGISDFADLQRRGEQVRDYLPTLWTTAESLMNANPTIANH